MKLRLLLLAIATLVFGSGASAQNQTQAKQLSIQVIASGAGHLVNLSWAPGDPVTCGAVVGYKVYRGSQPSNMVFLISTATTIYVDHAVVAGQTYLYYVTAVASSLSTCNPIESPASAIVSAAIPTP